MGRLRICADDFAAYPPDDDVSIELALAGKINAISCMAAAPEWPDAAAKLARLPADVEVGVHLVLTGEKPLTPMPRLAPRGLMPSAERLSRLAILKALPLQEIEEEVIAQFRCFENARGKQPDFVDGHQHTHVLPGIRRTVLAQAARFAPSAWVRSCEDRATRIAARPFPVRAAVNAIQSAGLAKAAAKAGLSCNDSFAGLYDFKAKFEPLLAGFLRRGGQFHLVICHPGRGGAPGDPIAAARAREAEALRLLPVRELAAANGLQM